MNETVQLGEENILTASIDDGAKMGTITIF